MRVYTAQMVKPESTHYNVTYAFKAENIDKEKKAKIIQIVEEIRKTFLLR